MTKSVVCVLLSLLLIGCASYSEQTLDIQQCKVYGLRAYQSEDVKMFKEIHIKDCKAVQQ